MATNLRRALEDRVARHPDRLAVRFGELAQSYAELNGSIDRAAGALRELGVSSGSRVALMLSNQPEMVWCWLALAKLGAVMVPVNTRLRGDSLRYLLGHADLDIAIVGGDSLGAFADARSTAACLRHAVRVGPGRDAETEHWPEFGALLRDAPREPPPDVPLPPEGLASIMYTSGTTGRPKGVLVGRKAQLQQGLNYGELLGVAEEETAYAFLPLFHVTAMGTALGSLLGGANVAIDRGFSPFGFWERTRRYGAVMFSFVGSVLTLLMNRPPSPDDTDNPVRRAMGAATPRWLWEDFERRFDLEIVETYGQTEWMSLWTMPPPEGRRVGTVGKVPHDRFAIKVADRQGEPLGPGVRGEIAIEPADRQDMATGYLKDPDATASAWRADGWYYTGDLGEYDADGYFRYVGRLKDSIRRGGENISAYEIEQVVNRHPRVLESAAVGVPSQLGEEEVKLCVVPRPLVGEEPQLDLREILRFCRAELPSFMVPRFVQVRDDLPKTATERVQKAALREEGTADCWEAGFTRSRPISGTADPVRTQRCDESRDTCGR